ncbi:MAG: hypothetical protein H2056_08260 [Sphingopyxis sp.]|nr:hypothetical protein [Sphingopyxis sp.]
MGMLQYGIFGFGGVAALIAVTGTNQQSAATFAVDAATAQERLVDAKRVVNGTGMGSLNLRSAGVEGDQVRVRIQRAGDENSITCLVAIEPSGEAASATDVDCSTDGNGTGAAANKARAMMAVIVEEHVAASINQTEYNIDAVSDQMISMIRF